MIQQDSKKDSIETVKLGEYLYIKGRIGWKGLKKDEYLDSSDYRIINGESLTKDGIDWNKAGFISKERYDESPEIMLQVGDILLSKDGTIGKIGYVDNLDSPSTVASGIFVIRNIKPNIISTQFIYYLLKSKLFSAFIASRTEGSVIPHLYQKDFMEFAFPLPNADEMSQFDALTSSLFATIIKNLRENEFLTATRDALLPKLMSGEIDVSAVKI
ncbi:restriction endonuclease subunit S [Ruminococcus flavefaciens]|uniref:restriction endonuclease subunit S n=1 Tax=Ruminococcus flavefaciens TaxID=1265 RepID=UPI0026EA2F6A|nr:restriction endonuclease subunit S [Ruminococcus flavefaciens]MDD7517132.1 restriction endonuclease subunit S [Ruminococcus flavefaciens]MDY5690484.1 restriction endonuclease subunit S [Ruminococcus flavefaciens]